MEPIVGREEHGWVFVHWTGVSGRIGRKVGFDYVVAQMGLNNLNYSAIDYMLGTILLVNYLLFIIHYLRKNLDSGSYNLLLNSKNNNYTISKDIDIDIQSAENCTGFSETIRQLSNTSETEFYPWLAGIIDGDGNFDIRKNSSLTKPVLKAIRIKLHNRDVRILTRIQNYLHKGALWCGISRLCLRLSNSGDTLKFLMSGDDLKAVYGWINYSCMVITRKMIEREIGYHVSKSIGGHNSLIVKEQQVDSDWCANIFPHLRFTLMGCVVGYQVKIPSNQVYGKIQVRNFHVTRAVRSELHNTQVIHPWYLTGFVDAEGCFLVIVKKNKNLNIGWNVELRFQINLHNRDTALLEKIKEYFGVGFVKKEGEDAVKYRVQSIKDMSIIISHLENYPLITQKRADYLIFKQIFDLIKNKEHLTMEGLHKMYCT